MGDFPKYDVIMAHDVDPSVPPMMAAILAVKIAECHEASTVLVDYGNHGKRWFDIRDVYAAMRRLCPNGGRELGVNLPEQREPSRPLWTVSLPPDLCSPGKETE